MHGDVGGGIKRGRVAVKTEEAHAGGEFELGREALAFGAGNAITGEPELPIGVCGKSGGEVDEFALIFLRSEHRDVEQNRGCRCGAVLGAKELARRSRRGLIV
jgi:hypothetical protein